MPPVLLGALSVALFPLPSGLRLLSLVPGGDASHRRSSFTGRTMRCAPLLDHLPGQSVPTSRTPASPERCSTPSVRILYANGRRSVLTPPQLLLNSGIIIIGRVRFTPRSAHAADFDWLNVLRSYFYMRYAEIHPCLHYRVGIEFQVYVHGV